MFQSAQLARMAIWYDFARPRVKAEVGLPIRSVPVRVERPWRKVDAERAEGKLSPEVVIWDCVSWRCRRDLE